MLTKANSQNTTDIATEQSPSNGGTNANPTDKEHSFKREDIENTPFTLIQDDEGNNYIVLGIHRLSAKCETKNEAIDYMDTWNFKTNVIAAMINITNEINKGEQK